MEEREQRGLVIAAICKLTRKGNVWLVPSQSADGTRYVVSPHDKEPHCTCLDHETRGCKCKHIYAVEFAMKREQNDDGSVTEVSTLTLTEKRTTYSQNWPKYNAAQVSEKDTLKLLLRELCRGIPEPRQAFGRPRLPIADAMFAACFKVYSTFSGRRFMTDLRDAHGEGYLGRCPSYNSIFAILESPGSFEILRMLVAESAAPLRALETHFSCDSSGFSGCRFDRWYDHKFGDRKIMRAWVKCHIMTGSKTNVVSAVEIHEQFAGDCVQLPHLLKATAKSFNVHEVSADMAYSTKENLSLVENMGATPLIPFKSNASPATGGTWAKFYHYFHLHREAFLSRYHLRSNVESTFSMIKRKFGDSVRSKLDVSMKNEVLCKLVCHNICCLISAIHELGIEPTFWQAKALA